jgi:hypothetical protein
MGKRSWTVCLNSFLQEAHSEDSHIEKLSLEIGKEG